MSKTILEKSKELHEAVTKFQDGINEQIQNFINSHVGVVLTPKVEDGKINFTPCIDVDLF